MKVRWTLADLAKLPRWVAWQTEAQPGRKPTKVPYASNGRRARADDPSTWDIRAAAERWAAKLPRPWGQGGVGIELGDLGNGISFGGADLDSCCTRCGPLDPWAAEVVDRLDSYTEFSPSQTGAKTLFAYYTPDLSKLRAMGLIENGNGGKREPGYGRQFKCGVGEHPPAIELYLGNRYFAVTDWRLPRVPVELRLVSLETLVWLLREAGPALATTAGPRQRPNSRDASRSAKAFAKGAAMCRAGKTFEEMCAALRADPETAAWCREKGDANGERELHRIWERAGHQRNVGHTLAFFNPWEDPLPPRWPGSILAREAEDTIALLSLRDGVDFGAQAMTYVAAAAGAAPKDARFAPYGRSGWLVPPIVWVMLIADSGQRKTALLDNGFAALNRIHGELWSEFKQQLGRWHTLSEDDRRAGGKPPEPHSFIVNDATLEKLQLILAANPRGALLLKDELASLLDFGRYSMGNGAAERAFYLECYEGRPFTVHRVGRESVYVSNAAMVIFGGAQPDRLAAFKGLDSDGLLQRFAMMLVAPAEISRPDVVVPGKERLDHAISQLAHLTARRYSTTLDGTELIRRTEREAAEFAVISDFGLGFQGFARKLHGTHARLALILHLLETPSSDQISVETIERAGRLALQFLLPHARNFYSTRPSAGMALTRDIGGWLLTKAPSRVRSSDVTSSVKACRGMGSKQLAEALDPFVIGGWLEPEEPFPSNRAWTLNPGLRAAFSERAKAEADRRAAIRALIRRMGNVE